MGQRDASRKATERGRETGVRQPEAKAPRPAGPHRRPGECVEQALPQAAHEEATLLTPRSQSSGSETGRTYFSSFNHLVCRTVSRQSRGLTQRLKPAGALWPHGTPIFLLQFAKVKDAPPTKPLSTHSVGLLVFFYKAKK